MQTSIVQNLITFFQSTSELISYEISQSVFWYQVVAIILAIVLSLAVSHLLGNRIRHWEGYFSKDNVSHKLARFFLRLTRKLFFSVFAALFLSLGASIISDRELLSASNFNLINLGYQIFYAWALLVFLIQVFAAFIATDSILRQIKKPLYVVFWILAILEIVEENESKRENTLEELLNEFSIAHLRKSPAIALSGGERRRLEIARALASNPDFILLDEPLAGIDPIAVGEIRSLVSQLKNRGLGVLITDHNVRETLDIIDRAYILHGGSVLMEGTPDEIVASKEVRKVYLGDNFSM